MEEFCSSQREALEQLERAAPGAPFLALGQTVFWDEPMKAGVVLAARRLGIGRPFLAGVHDTDYFAKVPHKDLKTGYAALPHNDTDTQALWSAAGEFSSLFGSETVVTRERLAAAGGKIALVASQRPGYLDEVTEAMGWRGIVSYGPQARTVAETPLHRLFETLYATFDASVQESLDAIVGSEKAKSEDAAAHLRAMVCDRWDGSEPRDLAEFYRQLAPKMYDMAAGQPLGIESTRTTELLRYNTQTCSRPRFALLGKFLDPQTRSAACAAYDAAVTGSQMYTLDKFGAGALPFDLYIPGVGRGTLRLGRRGGLVMCDEPVAFSFKKPVESVERLAEVIEAKFGSDVVLIGKAVSFVAMLASEYVFVMHEGASTYMPIARDFNRRIAELWPEMQLHPILRVRYEPWDALSECKAWFHLPEPLRRPFGAEEMSAESLAKRWRPVAAEQSALLEKLASLRRPLELIKFLDEQEGGQWSCLANECEAMQKDMAALHTQVRSVRSVRSKLVKELKRLKVERAHVEAQMGKHWRAKIFRKKASDAELFKREQFMAQLAGVLSRIEESKRQWRALYDQQRGLVSNDAVRRARERRRSIALEAELMRLRLIRSAVIATDGLRRAGHRPAAWWFPLVSPSGCWFKATMKGAEYYLEPLV